MARKPKEILHDPQGERTNPEELIAAAHAGCFTMALAFQLQAAGYTPRTEHRNRKVKVFASVAQH
jgi:organic hydroperoxide reductase OsmC/OhrA